MDWLGVVPHFIVDGFIKTDASYYLCLVSCVRCSHCESFWGSIRGGSQLLRCGYCGTAQYRNSAERCVFFRDGQIKMEMAHPPSLVAGIAMTKTPAFVQGDSICPMMALTKTVQVMISFYRQSKTELRQER